MKLSLRNKLIAVCLSTTAFVGLAIVFVIVVGGELERAIFVVLVIGIGISLFGEIYVQRHPGDGFEAYTRQSSLQPKSYRRGLVPNDSSVPIALVLCPTVDVCLLEIGHVSCYET
jgi:hypothetical protein